MSDFEILQRQINELQRMVEKAHLFEMSLGDVSVRVYNDAAISLANATWTTLTFNSELWDTHGMHSTSTNTDRLTCVHAGKYEVGACVRFASNATGYRSVRILINTTEIAMDIRAPVNGISTAITIGTPYIMVAGDYMTVSVLQDSGGALNVESLGNYTPEFWMTLIA